MVYLSRCEKTAATTSGRRRLIKIRWYLVNNKFSSFSLGRVTTESHQQQQQQQNKSLVATNQPTNHQDRRHRVAVADLFLDRPDTHSKELRSGMACLSSGQQRYLYIPSKLISHYYRDKSDLTISLAVVVVGLTQMGLRSRGTNGGF